MNGHWVIWAGLMVVAIELAAIVHELHAIVVLLGHE